MARDLQAFPLGWLEEPLPCDRPAHEWAQVAAAAAAPLAAGENLRGALDFQSAIDGGSLGVVQPDAAKWGGHSGCRPVALATLAAGRTYCPHFLGGALGLAHSLHLLASVRGPGLLEVDANPNPLREALLGDLLKVTDGALTLPAGPGVGFEPDLGAIAAFRTLHLERRG